MKTKTKKNAGRNLVLRFESIGEKALLFHVLKTARMTNRSDSCTDYELNVFANMNPLIEGDCITIPYSHSPDSGEPNEWWDRVAIRNFDGPCERLEYMQKIHATLEKWAVRLSCTNTSSCPQHQGGKEVPPLQVNHVSDTVEEITIRLAPMKNRY